MVQVDRHWRGAECAAGIRQQAFDFLMHLRPAAARGEDLRRLTVALATGKPLAHYRAGLGRGNAGGDRFMGVGG